MTTFSVSWSISILFPLLFRFLPVLILYNPDKKFNPLFITVSISSIYWILSRVCASAISFSCSVFGMRNKKSFLQIYAETKTTGGMLISMILAFTVLPIIFYLAYRKKEVRKQKKDNPSVEKIRRVFIIIKILPLFQSFFEVDFSYHRISILC